jgi:hypothetical protein
LLSPVLALPVALFGLGSSGRPIFTMFSLCVAGLLRYQVFEIIAATLVQWLCSRKPEVLHRHQLEQ